MARMGYFREFGLPLVTLGPVTSGKCFLFIKHHDPA
jgi:hypothetical protein